ncbi:MAG: hypothetical protein ACYS6K_17530 [Planctomycetota bacterium]|jgi:hypothetical protein
MTVIEQVKRVCFSTDVENREGLHRDVLNRLKALFVNGGYKVHLEYPIHFESRIRKSGDRISRDGNLDLVAFKNGRKIAVEFDTGVHLKFKSIEKLFQVDADMCIGIIKGRLDTLGSLNANVGRIEQVKGELEAFKKDIRLIILAEKIAHII